MKSQQGDNLKSAIHLILEQVAAATTSKQQYNTILKHFLWRRMNNQTYRHCDNLFWGILQRRQPANNNTTRSWNFFCGGERTIKLTDNAKTTESHLRKNQNGRVGEQVRVMAALTSNKQQSNAFWIRFL